MKRMHFAPSDIRVKFCKYLEKEDKELVHLSYGSTLEDDTVSFVAVACKCGNELPPNCYDVVTYDSAKDVFEYYSKYLNYENALLNMGQSIRRKTYTSTR